MMYSQDTVIHHLPTRDHDTGDPGVDHTGASMTLVPVILSSVVLLSSTLDNVVDVVLKPAPHDILVGFKTTLKTHVSCRQESTRLNENLIKVWKMNECPTIRS